MVGVMVCKGERKIYPPRVPVHLASGFDKPRNFLSSRWQYYHGISGCKGLKVCPNGKLSPGDEFSISKSTAPMAKVYCA